MKPQGILPDWDALVERFIFNIIDQHSFVLFCVISFVLGISILSLLNIINNALHIIRLNVEEFYRRR